MIELDVGRIRTGLDDQGVIAGVVDRAVPVQHCPVAADQILSVEKLRIKFFRLPVCRRDRIQYALQPVAELDAAQETLRCQLCGDCLLYTSDAADEL